MTKILIAACQAMLMSFSAQAASGGSGMDIVFETDFARLAVAPDGRAVRVEDKATGKNYAVEPAVPFASVTVNGKSCPAESVVRRSTIAQEGKRDVRLEVTFGGCGVTATIGVASCKTHIVFTVLDVKGEGVEELTFADFQTTLTRDLNYPFAVCALALNLRTDVHEIPGPNSRMRAICCGKFGIKGAKAALIACPTAKLRDIMKEVVAAAPDLPHSPLGGPWALDQPCNRESYFFNFGDLTEKTVDKWIELARNLGITEIDFHGGSSFRFGDCRPNPDMYPNGRASFKAVIDKLHAAGIKAGLHTYAHYIHESCPWVTPVPHPDLAKGARFTLARAIDEKTDTVPVNEPTTDMSTVTGFAVRNSVVLQIEDELIVFAGISKEPPYAFTNCRRGAYGTRAAAHPAGTPAHHVKQCFFLFSPEGGSDLMREVAAATADFYNECGFDMIYLDALDGEDSMGDPGEGRHYGSEFVFELFKGLKKPPIMEMSTFHHHLWYVRSRMGAWDHPVRGYKQFIDLHCLSNKGCDQMYLPAHLGWWRTLIEPDFQTERTYPDDLEYALAKCAAHHCGISPQEFTPESYAASGYLRRMAAIYKSWEELRLKGFFTEEMRKALAEPGRDFTLEKDSSGKAHIRRVNYAKHKVEGISHPSSSWTIENPFETQPARLRIEALFSVEPYDSPNAVTLTDFTAPDKFTERSASPGVTAGISPSTDRVIAGSVSGLFTAQAPPSEPGQAPMSVGFSPLEHAQRVVTGTPAYCKLGIRFDPARDLTDKTALGVWVYGDGGGEILNLQLLSPEHLMTGYCDRYIPIDFTGWRYFELVEAESERAETFRWPYSGSAYVVYRQGITPGQIESLNLWYNAIPAGGTARCYLSPVRALPIVKSALRNPAVTVNGRKLVFPAELASGCWIEYNSPSDCKLYNEKGEFVSDVEPKGEPVEARHGQNDIGFSCDPLASGVNPRALVTLISEGPEVE